MQRVPSRVSSNSSMLVRSYYLIILVDGERVCLRIALIATKNDGPLRTRPPAASDRCSSNCVRSRGPIADTISQHYTTEALIVGDSMRARCVAERSGQGTPVKLEHVRLKNLVSSAFSINFIPLVSFTARRRMDSSSLWKISHRQG